MANTEETLELKFDPRTIEHLGIKMYSQLPYALAELVANAYDAGASNVNISLYDGEPDDKKIVIDDDGDGMSYEEVRDNFLVIGRKRRDTDEGRINSKGRRITGKKGLGKLALFGIGKIITIETTKTGESQKTVFTLDWDNILSESSGVYHPVEERIDKEDINEKGTKIVLSKLSRVTAFDLNSTAVSLSKLFNCFDSGFNISMSKNDEEHITLTRDMIYEGIDKEFEWDVKDIISELKTDYEYKTELKGTIISSKKPMRQDLRGITLYVNGRLANIPGFFGVSEAGHTFSYISGWIDADYLDEFDKDLISTDRQSISWDLPEAEELKDYLQSLVKFLVKDWSNKRKKAKKDNNTGKTGINIEDWYAKVPDLVRPKLASVIDRIADKPEINDVEFSAVVHTIYDLIPPYTYYHYRLLHEQVRDSAGAYYRAKDYYQAFHEAMKRYKNAVKDKSGVAGTEDRDIVANAFGKDKVLETTAKFKKRPNGQPFAEKTLENIEEGQKFLSMGVVCGGRNILSHEEIADLRDSKLFTEKDCLDLLSLLSHLFKRLDESQKK